MSGQCLCSECVEARQKIRGHVPGWIGDWWLPEPQHPEPPADDLRGLAAYDQARDVRPAGWDAAVERILAAMPALSDAELDAMLDREDRAAAAGARARAMREARERAGASCP